MEQTVTGSPEKKDYVIENGIVIMRSKGESSPTSLGLAISGTIFDHYGKNRIQIRALGANAVNQAAKALVHARMRTISKGIDFLTSIYFEDVPDKKKNDDTTMAIVVFEIIFQKPSY